MKRNEISLSAITASGLALLALLAGNTLAQLDFAHFK
jgi:hypothetical protein